MIKIGSSDVDTIKIGSTDVDKVMLGGEQLYPNAAECDPLPGDAAAFIATHTSVEEDALSASNPQGIFPNGPNMMLAWYSPEATNKPGVPNALTTILNAGLTLAGPNYGNGWDEDPDSAPTNCSWARDNNKKVFVHIRPSAGGTSETQWADLNSKLSTQGGRDDVYDFIVARVQSFVDLWDDVVEGWAVGPDDATTSNSTYYGIVKDAITFADPKKRPYVSVPRTDAAIGVDKANANDGMPIMSHQVYIIRDNNYAYGCFTLCDSQPCDDELFCESSWPLSCSSEYNKALYRNTIQYFVEKHKGYLANAGTPYTGSRGTVVMLLQDYDDVYVDGQIYEQDAALAVKFQKHDFWATMLSGADGINYYSNAYYSTANGGEYTLTEQNTAIREQFGVLTGMRGEGASLSSDEVAARVKASVQRALLWGVKKSDLTFGITNGARTDTPSGWGPAKDVRVCYQDSWYAVNVQHQSSRFVMMINSHPVDTVNVTVSGFPTSGLRLRNLHTDEIHALSSGQVSFSYSPLEFGIFIVEADTGYCGGDQPTKPVVSGPEDQSSYVGSTTAFNVVASGGAPYTYQWYRNGAPTVTTQTYTTEVLSAGDDGDQVYVFVTNSAGTTQSQTANLTVLDVPLSIAQDLSNPTRWIYKGQPITLIGGLWTHQPWAQTDANMKSDLAALDAAGGNYHRCNMGLYQSTAITNKYHCTGSPGSFDLMTMVDENDGSTWWGMFKNYLTEMQRLGMCTTVELFDPWYHGYWEGLSTPEHTNNPWRPVNTSTYDETTSGLSNTLDSVAEFTALTHQDLIDAQEAYVTKLLSICSQFDNTLIQIDNESFALTPWTQHWIDFVHANSDLNVIDMNSTEDIDQSDARRGITLNTDGADLSQNGRTGSTIMEGDTAYRKATSYLTAMAGSASQRPVNSSKTYARATSGSSDADDNGLNSQGMYFCSDVGIVGQHKGDGTFDSQTDGLGGTTEGNNILTVMRSVDSMISRNEMSQIDIPASGSQVDGNWTSREPNLAYAMSGGGKICVFFSQESDQLGVNILADEISTSSCRIDWIDADGSTGNIERTETIAKVDGFVNVRRLVAYERWFAVVSATT